MNNFHSAGLPPYYYRQLTPRGRLHFWRTQTGDGVDFVVEHGRRVLGVEVKMTSAQLSARGGVGKIPARAPSGCWRHSAAQWAADPETG